MSCFIVSLTLNTHAVTVSLVSLILLYLDYNVDVQSGSWVCVWELGKSHRCWGENDKAEAGLMYMSVIQNEVGSDLKLCHV